MYLGGHRVSGVLFRVESSGARAFEEGPGEQVAWSASTTSSFACKRTSATVAWPVKGGALIPRPSFLDKTLQVVAVGEFERSGDKGSIGFSGLVHVRDNAEAIAFYGGEKREEGEAACSGVSR